MNFVPCLLRSVMVEWCSVCVLLWVLVGHMLHVELGGIMELIKTVSVLGQQVHYCLVGAHHDGRVGDLTHQLSGQPTINATNTFLVSHCAQRLPEPTVLGAFLAEPRTGNLCNMKIHNISMGMNMFSSCHYMNFICCIISEPVI